MGDFMFGLIVVSLVLVGSWGWRVFNWVCLKPMKMEKYLRDQGLTGSHYRLLYGNTKEVASLMRKEQSKPMELSHRIVPRLLPFVHQMVKTYGKSFLYWHGPTPRVTIMDPGLIRDVLLNKMGHFPKIRANPLTNFVAKGVAKYEGEKWVKHRKIINPAFHVEKLKMMVPAFHTCCSELISKWKKEVSEGSSELDVWLDLQKLTADVISRTAFGSSYKEGQNIFQLQAEQATYVIQALHSIYIPGFRFLPTKRNQRMKEIHRQVHTLLRDMINKREKAMKLGQTSSQDLLGILMESNYQEIRHGGNAKYGMSIDEVIEECKLFYFAGQETTSTLLVWTMIALSMHPEWQKKAREEVLQAIGRNKPDFDTMPQLKTVTMILYEVLRLYPPIVSLTRTTVEKTKLGELVLPPGVEISMPTLMVHHDRELWGEDADEFKPDRFSDGVLKATKNQASYFPFGGGQRICIGQVFAMKEAIIALVIILQNFSFQLSPSYIHAPHLIVTIQPQHGAQLVLSKL